MLIEIIENRLGNLLFIHTTFSRCLGGNTSDCKSRAARFRGRRLGSKVWPEGAETDDFVGKDGACTACRNDVRRVTTVERWRIDIPGKISPQGVEIRTLRASISQLQFQLILAGPE